MNPHKSIIQILGLSRYCPEKLNTKFNSWSKQDTSGEQTSHVLDVKGTNWALLSGRDKSESSAANSPLWAPALEHIQGGRPCISVACYIDAWPPTLPVLLREKLYLARRDTLSKEFVLKIISLFIVIKVNIYCRLTVCPGLPDQIQGTQLNFNFR